MYERKDHFYKKAKKEGFASRAVYKLAEIQKKYRVLKKGGTVLDLGCAPGGWIEIASQEVGPKGKVIGVDRLPLKIKLPPNAIFLQKKMEEISEGGLPGSFDTILSDLSPDLSGIAFRDTYQSFELAKLVWEIAKKYLKPGGNLVIKIFPGEETKAFQAELKKSFSKMQIFIPEATRKSSSEVYLIFCANRRNPLAKRTYSFLEIPK